MADSTHYRDIEAAEDLLRDRREAYLRRWGWRQTSNTPGAFWMWQRDFAPEDANRLKWWEEACARNPPLGNPSKPHPMGVITASLEIAVSMTVRSLDTQPELGTPADD